MFFTAASSPACRRPVMKTYAPSATNRFAVARPMPLFPPVTTATLPSSFPLIVSSPHLLVSEVIQTDGVVASHPRMSRRWLTPRGKLSAQRQAGTRSARHQPPLLVDD